MSNYFKISTYTPWDGQKSKIYTEVKLQSLKSIFTAFPVIEKEFFDDLISNVYNHKQYSAQETIKRVVGPNNEDYDIKDWSFVWAFDDQNRMFQFLFQKVKTEKKISQAVLAALAPPELGHFFAQFKKEAIQRTLSLLNTPLKIKFLLILGPKGKSIAEEAKLFQLDKSRLEGMKFINKMANMPNIQGQWFPEFQTNCPICNALLTMIQDKKAGFGKMVCPKCGYQKLQ